MWDVDVSLFASAVRQKLWFELCDSLKSNKRSYEIVFAGNSTDWQTGVLLNPEIRHIETGNIKPAQCYELARRACKGELIGWIADDCRFSPGFIDKVYDFYKSIDNGSPAIISCRTNENHRDEGMLNHRFFDRNQNTPLMAPLAIMSAEYLEYLGGLDIRYVAGQYENDLVMRALADGAKVHILDDVEVTINHLESHGSTTKFWDSYEHDRKVLENSWCVGGFQPNPEPFIKPGSKLSEPPSVYFPIKNVEVTLERNDAFQPYPSDISTTFSYGPKGIFE